MSGKTFVDYCWLELNVADAFKPELLLCRLETQTFNLVSSGCKNLFSMQMLVNYSTEWLLGHFCGAILTRSSLLWGISNSFYLHCQLKNSRKLFLFPCNGVLSKAIKMAVEKRNCWFASQERAEF